MQSVHIVTSRRTLTCCSLPLAILLICPTLTQAKYDDTVFLVNGDRIMGDVEALSRDLLRYKTDSRRAWR